MKSLLPSTYRIPAPKLLLSLLWMGTLLLPGGESAGETPREGESSGPEANTTGLRTSRVLEEFDPPERGWELRTGKAPRTEGYLHLSLLESDPEAKSPRYLEITLRSRGGVRIYPRHPFLLEEEPIRFSVRIRVSSGGGELFGDFQWKKGRIRRISLGRLQRGEWETRTLDTKGLMRFPLPPGEKPERLRFLGFYFAPAPGLNRISLDRILVESEPPSLRPPLPWEKTAP